MRYKSPMSESLQVQLKKGVLEMCVLALLSKGDNYAYEIASQMADAVGMGVTDDAGEAELLITSAWSGVHGHHSGRIFIISSGVHPRVHRFGKRWRI